MARRSFQAGYSLLEIIVVVAILSLAVAIAVPSIGRMLERQQARQTVQLAASELSRLRVEAYLDGATISADAIDAHLLATLPEGWRAQSEEQLEFRATGFCIGGGVIVTEPPGRTWRLRVNGGDCAVSRDS